nr:hypothetical protein Iba_chr11eCG4690 [Ipomoea batatas]
MTSDSVSLREFFKQASSPLALEASSCASFNEFTSLLISFSIDEFASSVFTTQFIKSRSFSSCSAFNISSELRDSTFSAIFEASSRAILRWHSDSSSSPFCLSTENSSKPSFSLRDAISVSASCSKSFLPSSSFMADSRDSDADLSLILLSRLALYPGIEHGLNSDQFCRKNLDFPSMNFSNLSGIISVGKRLVFGVTSHGKLLLHPLQFLSGREKSSHVQSVLAPHRLDLFLPFLFLLLSRFNASLLNLNSAKLLNLRIILSSLLSYQCLSKLLVRFLSQLLRFLQIIKSLSFLLLNRSQLLLGLLKIFLSKIQFCLWSAKLSGPSHRRLWSCRSWRLISRRAQVLRRRIAIKFSCSSAHFTGPRSCRKKKVTYLDLVDMVPGGEADSCLAAAADERGRGNGVFYAKISGIVRLPLL